MKRKFVIVAGTMAALVAAGLGFFWPFGNGDGTLSFPGFVEIQEVRLASKVRARVWKLECDEGDKVKPGDVLIRLEAPELLAQRAQLQAKIAAAQAEWKKAEYGARDEEKEAAEAAARAAQARYERVVSGWPVEKEQAKREWDIAEVLLAQARLDFERMEVLYRDKKSASKAEYDAAKAARDSGEIRAVVARLRYDIMSNSRKEDIAEARAEWDKAKAQWLLLKNGTRPEDKDLAKAQLDDAKAKQDELDVLIRELEVTVPKHLGAAVVTVLPVRPGDLVEPGQPLIRVLRTDDLWVRFFIPETDQGKIEIGLKVELTIDAYPGRRFPGTIISINPVSEFTPRNVQTRDERRHQVFGVKVRIDRHREIFHAGMAAEVFVPGR